MDNKNTTGQKKAAAQPRGAKKGRKIAILAVEVLLLAIMICVLWVVTRATDEETGVKKVEISADDIIINDGVKNKGDSDAEQETSADAEADEMDKYRTIALFGLDSTIGELIKGTRSDTIMIASLNSETKEVRIMSVYRDTYLNLSNDTYNKCNAAYAKGGPEQAINMLNMNLDLNITDYVTVGWAGVADTIDALGGVEISEQGNVSKVLTAVEEQSCEVGTVYYSDTYGHDDIEIIQQVDPSVSGDITYPIAQIVNQDADDTETAAAADFLSYIQSDEALQVLENYQFIVK